MKDTTNKAARFVVNRRAFLRAGAIAVGLPFLEGLPARSAWAADAPPVFSLFICAACGVVGKKFFPNAVGPLSRATLSSQTDKATSVLASHAENLLFVRGINFPMSGPTACGHAQGLCQVLTGAPAASGGQSATSGGPSADVAISNIVNGGADPLTLYAGNRRNGYIAERLSFAGAGPGQVRSAQDNPYELYAKLIGLTSRGTTTGGTSAADRLLTERKSVNDLVGEELKSLLSDTRLSAADRMRLEQHFDALRSVEVTMTNMAASAQCTLAGANVTALDALKSGLVFRSNGMIEDVAKLHLELVAIAFACNLNRVATLQHGDGTDATKYDVPSNAKLNWPFHHLSHRVPSDSATGMNDTAEQAHAEIDVLRMQTLLHGLDAFKSRGLADKSFVMWTNHVADGPSHSFRNVPVILWGSGGGRLKQGAYVDAGDVTNNKLLNTLITVAVQDKRGAVTDFGKGTGTGQLPAILKS